MTSPTLELQGEIVTALKANPGVAALVGARVYDIVPSEEDRVSKTGAAFPYISLGPTDEVSDDTDCTDGFEITLQIDCWSRKQGFPEARQIADAVRQALKPELTLTDNALVYLQHITTRTFRDPDGLTSHAALTFEAFAEQPTS